MDEWRLGLGGDGWSAVALLLPSEWIFDILYGVKKSSCKVKYRRILLKLSGEVLGNKSTGECIDPKNLAFMAERIKKIHAMGVEVGIVLGGGNIFRGLTGAGKGVNRVTGDSMGMLATIINALAMMNALESIGVPRSSQSPSSSAALSGTSRRVAS